MNAPLIPRNQILRPRLPDHASVKLIGLGGVGQIVARYGALFLASLGSEVRFVLIDGDTFEPANASRALFGRCGNKAAVLREELLGYFSESSLWLESVEEYVAPDNIDRLIHDADIVLLAVDNHATRRLLADACARLNDVCLLSGGNDGVGKDGSGTFRRGTYGNVQAYVRRNGQDVTTPLTRHHTEIAHPTDRLPSDQSCTELIASVPQILFTNLAVASAILNTLWLYLAGGLTYQELAFDIAEGLMRPSARLPVPL
jgi:hypothetical protein